MFFGFGGSGGARQNNDEYDESDVKEAGPI